MVSSLVACVIKDKAGKHGVASPEYICTLRVDISLPPINHAVSQSVYISFLFLCLVLPSLTLLVIIFQPPHSHTLLSPTGEKPSPQELRHLWDSLSYPPHPTPTPTRLPCLQFLH